MDSIKTERIGRQVIRIGVRSRNAAHTSPVFGERLARALSSARAKTFRRMAALTQRPACTASKAELALEQVVHGLRIGLAAQCFHHLTDEPHHRLRIGLRLRDLVGVLRDDLVDDLLDGTRV